MLVKNTDPEEKFRVVVFAETMGISAIRIMSSHSLTKVKHTFLVLFPAGRITGQVSNANFSTFSRTFRYEVGEPRMERRSTDLR